VYVLCKTKRCFFEETINNRYIKFILTELLGELEEEEEEEEEEEGGGGGGGKEEEGRGKGEEEK